MQIVYTPLFAVTPLAHNATLHSVCSSPDVGYCPPHISSSKHSVKVLVMELTHCSHQAEIVVLKILMHTYHSCYRA